MFSLLKSLAPKIQVVYLRYVVSKLPSHRNCFRNAASCSKGQVGPTSSHLSTSLSQIHERYIIIRYSTRKQKRREPTVYGLEHHQRTKTAFPQSVWAIQLEVHQRIISESPWLVTALTSLAEQTCHGRNPSLGLGKLRKQGLHPSHNLGSFDGDSVHPSLLVLLFPQTIMNSNNREGKVNEYYAPASRRG